jgi:uncharacterized protein (TIGR01777 family)
MKNVLITGGTGLVGNRLVDALVKKGYHVTVLSRQEKQSSTLPGVVYSKWDFRKDIIDQSVLEKADAVIHLAGAGVMDKSWTEAYQKEIVESRTESIKYLLQKLASFNHKVKTLVSASAIGWYGPDLKDDYAFSEEDNYDNHFLGTTCKVWEESAELAENMGIRVCKLRIGIVLSKDGGALPELMRPVKMGIAAILGSGKQMVSWIHIEDLCRMFIFALENEKLSGSYNAVAPQPTSHKNLIFSIARILKRSFWIPVFVPSILLKCMLGKRSIELLKSTTVSSKKISAAGFTFLYPEVGQALKKLLRP